MQFLLYSKTPSNSRKMCGNGIPPLSPEGSQSILLIPDSPEHTSVHNYIKSQFLLEKQRGRSNPAELSYKSSLHSLVFSCQILDSPAFSHSPAVN